MIREWADALRRCSLRGGAGNTGQLRHILLVLACCTAGLSGALGPLLNTTASNAYACGLGNSPTMYANADPSILKPITLNTPPSARPVVGYFARQFVVGQSITFTEDLTNMLNAPPVKSLQWQWEFGDGVVSHDVTPAHTYTKPGTYAIYSGIFDLGSWSDFDSSTLTVIAAAPTQPPVIVATSSAIITDASTEVTFNATGSHAVDGSSVNYSWNFADGQTATSPQTSAEFPPAALGNRSVVTLVVTDRHGAQSVKYFNIEIVPDLPEVVISSDLSGGTTATFTAASFFPQGTANAGGGSQSSSAVPSRYTWNFGDGTSPLTTDSTRITHTFRGNGTFRVTVTVLDQHGFPYPYVGSVTVTVRQGILPLLLGFLAVVGLLAGAFFLLQEHLRRNARSIQHVADM